LVTVVDTALIGKYLLSNSNMFAGMSVVFRVVVTAKDGRYREAIERVRHISPDTPILVYVRKKWKAEAEWKAEGGGRRVQRKTESGGRMAEGGQRSFSEWKVKEAAIFSFLILFWDFSARAFRKIPILRSLILELGVDRYHRAA
jgi:hypothetical protein